MNKFAKLFKKVGGKEILKRYARAHVLVYALFLSLWLGFSKKSLEILRNAVDNKILKKLRRKNKNLYPDILQMTGVNLLIRVLKAEKYGSAGCREWIMHLSL